jgi:hypothetical protein
MLSVIFSPDVAYRVLFIYNYPVHGTIRGVKLKKNTEKIENVVALSKGLDRVIMQRER